MAETTPTDLQPLTGSCHCGYIKYRISLAVPKPPAVMTVSRCNCTVCHKSGFMSVNLSSRADFTLLHPSSLDEVPDYQWRSTAIHRYFCNKCGVQVAGFGVYKMGDKEIPFASVNALTLDQEQLVDAMDLRKWKVRYWDGKHDNWESGPRDEPWEQGCI
jgi:hypothetical protein